MAKLLLIANPAASGFTGGLHRDVMRILSGPHQVEAVWPTSPGQVEDLATEAVDRGFGMVTAFGGDGVVHHIACRLTGTNVTMGIIPAGTTNVLARILRLPSRPKAAARYLASEPSSIDVPMARIDATGRGGRTKTYAAFAAGLGLDAEVVALAEQEPYRKYRFGSLHYARSTGVVLATNFNRRLANLRVYDTTRELDAVSVLVQVHDPYTYFGRVPLSVSGKSIEGLAALVLEELSLWRVPAILQRAVRRADLGRVKGLTVWNGLSEVMVHAEPESTLQADGELLGLFTDITFTAVPDGLKVAAPADSSA